MKGKLEKDIEQQLSDFTLEPTPQVWEEVEAVLHPRRKRRVIAWWWFAIPATGIAIMAIWFYNKQLYSTANGNAGNTGNNSTTARTNHQPSVSSNTDSSVSTTVTTHPSSQDSGIATQSTFYNDHQPTKATGNNNQHKKQGVNQVSTTEAQATPAAGNDHTLSPDTTLEATTEEMMASLPVTNPTDTNHTVKKHDTTTAAKKKQPTDSAAIAGKAKKASNNEHLWSVVIGGGPSLIKGSTLFSSNTNDAYTNATGPATTYPPSTTRGALPTPLTGFFLLGGIQYEQMLRKHWQGYISLQYRYIQNKQLVGVDSITGSYGFDNYYTRGNTDTKKNVSHWLDLPIHIGYIFNPSAKNQFQLLGGGSLAYTVDEQWLIADNTTRRYYYKASLNNHFVVSLLAGVSYDYNHLFKIAFWAEQSLMPIQRVTDKYYWQQFSTQVSLPLSTFKPKHHTK